MKKEAILKAIEKENAIVSDILPYLKANRYTYYNLSEQDKKSFQNSYNRLLQYKDAKIGLIAKLKIKAILNNDQLILDYLYKHFIIEELQLMKK